MVEALSSAQQGKDILAEMVVDLETQLDQTKSDKAAAYLDNSTLANEVRRFEGKLSEVTSERDRICEARSKEKSAFSQSIDELKSQMDALSFDKEAAMKALSRAEEAHRLERGALDEQLSRARKFNDNLNDQLAQNEVLLARSVATGTEAKMVSRSERQMREMFEGHLGDACGHQDHLRTRMRELEAEAADATKQYQRATDMICSLQEQLSELKASKATGLTAARSDQAALLAERSSLSSENGTLGRDNGALNAAVKQLRCDLQNEQRENSHLKSSLALSEATLTSTKAKLADSASDEALLCSENEQLRQTIKLLSSEKDNLLKQKSGDHGAHIQELTVLRSAFGEQQNNTEAAVTQVRTEKSKMMIEIAELSEKLASSTAECASLTSQLNKAEQSAARVLAHNEELIGEKRFYESQGGFHTILPK